VGSARGSHSIISPICEIAAIARRKSRRKNGQNRANGIFIGQRVFADSNKPELTVIKLGEVVIHQGH
jgi:hypothetical protein